MERGRRPRRNEDSEHCLILVYSGEYETRQQKRRCFDSLHSFLLHLDMVEDVGLDERALAMEMTMALAVPHWQAEVDAMDVEFVLGSAGPTTMLIDGMCTRHKPALVQWQISIHFLHIYL